eukprot:TRINITY_DN25837_c0_g1_i1.p1 TRINITY_DN25837_c0_g1~~TRINITY_DN25837_c0_g1_i1.p1  ORF type:complete len:451 (+),score=74.81 TRINITY_DN25837_c0_g1_i1:94-1446(+)
MAALKLEERIPVSIDHFRIQVLGWQAFLDVPALSTLHAASPKCAHNTSSYLLAALILLLQRQDCSHRALKMLARVAPKGHPRVIEAVASCLASHDCCIRRLATRSLRSIVAGPGDMTAVKFTSTLLSHECEDVRESAVAAFGRIAGRGDLGAIALITSCLADQQLRVRMAATDALHRIAMGNLQAAVPGVVELLDHEDAGTREVALIALQRIVSQGQGDVYAAIAALESGIGCMRPEGRKMVLLALQQIAPRGEPDVLSKVVRFLGDADVEVKKCTLQTLGTLADSVDTSMLKALADSFQDANPIVRAVAVAAFGKLAVQDERLQVMMVERLDDPIPSVRCAAILVVGRCAKAHDETVPLKLASFMAEDEDRVCQLAAQQALGQLLHRGFASTLPVLRRLLLEHPECSVRNAAQQALERLPQQWQWLRCAKWTPNLTACVSTSTRVVSAC